MKRLIFSVVVMGVFATRVVLACPTNCTCDASGKVISTNTNTDTNVINSGNTSKTVNKNTYNTKTTDSNNTDNSVHQTTASSASVGNVSTGASTSNATGGSAKQHQSQTQKLTNSGNSTVGDLGNASASANGSGNGNVSNVTEDYRAPKIPVSTAYAPGLTSGYDTCLGSMSGGAQTVPVGITFGGTKEDKNCIFIKKAHLIGEGSRRAECFYIRAHDKEIDQAYHDAGMECPSDEPPPIAARENDVQYATIDDLREVERRIFTKAVSK